MSCECAQQIVVKTPTLYRKVKRSLTLKRYVEVLKEMVEENPDNKLNRQ